VAYFLSDTPASGGVYLRKDSRILLMTGERRQYQLFFALLYFQAFVFNFCWESLHGMLYEGHQSLAASVYVPMMLRMALFDALAITGLYLLTSLFSGTLVWSPGRKNSAVFFLAAIVASYAVEYFSVHIFYAWAYGELMPILFGVGLAPLLQLSLTGLLSVIFALGLSRLPRP
jgi:hypothetical protein